MEIFIANTVVHVDLYSIIYRVEIIYICFAITPSHLTFLLSNQDHSETSGCLILQVYYDSILA